MEKYLEILISQIRCKKARTYIADEIKDHIECQIEDNIAKGMSCEDAEKYAVIDMGDPVETGIELDRIHRPRFAWSLVIIVGIISVFGILVHYLISKNIIASEPFSTHPKTLEYNKSYYSGVVLGLVAMMIVYFIDYSVIAKYARVIGGTIIGIGFLSSIFEVTISGISYVGIGGFRIMETSFFLLYVPIYGAILYKYRNTKWKGLVPALLWLLAPILTVLRTMNVYAAAVLFISLVVMLLIAVADGWFLVPKKRMMTSLIFLFVLVPPIGLDYLLWDYQKERIRAFLHPERYRSEAGFLASNLKEQMTNSVFLGSNGMNILDGGENYTGDYILTYITGTYGILVALIVCSFMAVLIIAIFMAANKQKNRVGMLMGCGCGILFLVNAGINVLENIGWLPLSQTFMPFLSSGRSNLVLAYILIGLIMSIYRYKDIYPRDFKENKTVNAS